VGQNDNLEQVPPVKVGMKAVIVAALFIKKGPHCQLVCKWPTWQPAFSLQMTRIVVAVAA